MTINRHDEFVKYPTGKINKGEWCDSCKRFNTRNVTCTVIGIKEGKLLLVKRAHDPMAGFWAMPGGYLSWDETVEECAVREYKEESGFSVVNLKLLGIYSSPKRDADGRQNVDCCFVGEVVGVGGKHDLEVEEIRWFDLNEIPDKMAFDHGKMVKDFLVSSIKY
jgi:8-oxo-dGTP diphosphatase